MLPLTPGYIIREATFVDASMLARYRLQMFSEIEQQPTDDEATAFESHCRQTFEGLLRSGNCVAWLAEVPGESVPVGTLVMLKFPRLPTLNNSSTIEGYIINVYVVPAFRRKGIASALMLAAIDYSRRERFARIRLRATEAGQAVYEQVGFRLNDNVMELKLGAV
jgi:ribosomal protein S18 acetylase RimI-like enzyme